MLSNTKFLVVIAFIVLFSGFGLLWLGFKNNTAVETIPASTQVPESASLGVDGEKVIVSRVIDGDTFEIENGKSVRLVGIDTPETVDPRRPVGCFGKEASNETKNLLTGKVVILQKDVSDTDKYGRLLRLVYLPLEDGQMLFVNDYLVREGFAKNYPYPPDVKFDEQLKEAGVAAKENKLGLWGACQ